MPGIKMVHAIYISESYVSHFLLEYVQKKMCKTRIFLLFSLDVEPGLLRKGQTTGLGCSLTMCSRKYLYQKELSDRMT